MKTILKKRCTNICSTKARDKADARDAARDAAAIHEACMMNDNGEDQEMNCKFKRAKAIASGQTETYPAQLNSPKEFKEDFVNVHGREAFGWVCSGPH